jgi:hypothetical protein
MMKVLAREGSLKSLELMMKVPYPKCWRRFIEVAKVNDEGSFSKMLEGPLKSPESKTRVPSPECWRWFVEVAGVDDEGSFSKMLEKVR